MGNRSPRSINKQKNSAAAVRALSALIALFFAFGLFNTFYNAPLFNAMPTLFWLVDALQFVVVPGLGLWLMRTRYGFSWRALGFPPAAEYGGVAGFVALVFLVTMCFFGTLKFVDVLVELVPPAWTAYLPPREFASFAQVVPAFGPGKWIAVLYLAASAGFAEELIYRALVYTWCRETLSKRFRSLAYIVISASAFSIVHFEQGLKPILSIFALGVVIALLYSKLRMLPVFMIAHMLTDIAEFS